MSLPNSNDSNRVYLQHLRRRQAKPMSFRAKEIRELETNEMEEDILEKWIMERKPISLPVVCISGKADYIETEMIQLPKLDTNKVYYSSLISDEDGRNNFRIKLIYQGNWCIYVAYWEQDILDDQFLCSKPPFTYKVTVWIERHGTIISDYQVKQLYHNTWMQVYVFHNYSNSSFKIKISGFEIKTLPMIQLPSPLMLELTYGDHRSVTLKGKDSSQIMVLQSILEEYSDIFSRMFAGDWQENKERSVEIDLDKAGLDEFKEYLYCSIVPKDCAAELFPVAHLYDMKHLKAVCAERLRDEVTSGNADAMEIMAIALHYKYKPLVAAIWLYWEEYRNEIFP